MNQYLNLVHNVLQNGVYKQNRTGVDTIAAPAPQHYNIGLGDGFPLLTTKQMDTYRWDSLLEELVWYLSGDHHIRDLDTRIWDAWADDNGNLETAYGRFWRRMPIPESDAALPGEAWADEDCRWVTRDAETQTLVFDQIQYIVDTLSGENPEKTANSRRLMVTPWHPANAAVSTLPPCHCFWGVNVQDGALNLHLTQRSGDIALGIPFNIASYSLLLKMLAQQTGFDEGVFSHTIIDAHIYCGSGDRGAWYQDHLADLQTELEEGSFDRLRDQNRFPDLREWIETTTPAESSDGEDHVPGLLRQLSRTPKERPEVVVTDKPLDELTADDVSLTQYQSHGPLSFGVAE